MRKIKSTQEAADTEYENAGLSLQENDKKLLSWPSKVAGVEFSTASAVVSLIFLVVLARLLKLKAFFLSIVNPIRYFLTTGA